MNYARFWRRNDLIFEIRHAEVRKFMTQSKAQENHSPPLKKFSRRFVAAVVLLSALAVWAIVAPLPARLLVVERPLERADVILILAGSSVYKERADRAAELFKQNIAPQIVLTDDGERGGWSSIEQRNPPFVELAKARLIADGVPAERIAIIKPDGSGTIYEARIFSETAGQNGWQSVLLVTSAYHTRRALRTFERAAATQDIKIGIVHTAFSRRTPAPDLWWLSADGWVWVTDEYVKSVYYWAFY